MDTRGRSWPRLVAINVAVFVALVAMAEGAWRLLVPLRDSERREAAFVAASLAMLEPCARVEDRGGAAFIVADEAPERQSFAFPLERDRGVARVAVIGESSGSMLGWEMRSLVNEWPPGRRPQLLGCARPGAALEHVQLQAEEVLGYDPDVLVIVFGHNVDFEYPLDRGYLEAVLLRTRSRLLSGLAARLPSSAPRKAFTLESRLDRFEQWLRDLAAHTHRRGVTLVLTTLTSNLWVPPRGDVAAINEPRLIEARFDYAEGRREDAIAAMLELTEDSDEPTWHFVVGVWLARAGRLDEAAEHLRFALDAERSTPSAHAPLGRDRASSAVNDRIRAVAALDGVVLRDTAGAMEASAPAGMPGWDVMEDHCHLQVRVTRVEAGVVLEHALTAAGVGDEAAAGRAPRQQPAPPAPADLVWVLELVASNWRSGSDSRVALALALERWLELHPEAARAAVEQYLAGTGFAAQTAGGRRGELLAGLADGYWYAGERDEARRLNALARDHAVAAPWIQLGLFELAEGDDGAARDAFLRADAIDPGLADVTSFLARLRAGAGGASSDTSRP